MLLFLQVFTVFLVAVTMSMALAHALEYPGKRRLDEQTYLAVQTIYYPGFTLGGIGEILAILSTLLLLILMRDRQPEFWWIFSALIAVATMHLVFWLVTQPVNRYWLKTQNMSKAGSRFFDIDRGVRSASENPAAPDWRWLRDRWEYSHIVRAVLSIISLTALVVALAIRSS